MQKIHLALVIGLFFFTAVSAQDMKQFHLYHPEENADSAIQAAVKQAKQQGKHVLIQAGGNWCIWCARFNDFVTTDKQLDSAMHAGFVVYHLNYSKENYNAKVFRKYGFPQRFGFPVILVLDNKGNLLHTQNSAYLEEGKSYSHDKVIGFFNDWSPAALDPKQYHEQ